MIVMVKKKNCNNEPRTKKKKESMFEEGVFTLGKA